MVTIGIRYPLMKLVDMYFWETGYERDVALSEKVPGAGQKP